MRSEADWQSWLEEQLLQGTLSSSVQDAHGIPKILDDYSTRGIPALPIDYLLRLKSLRSADVALKALNGLELVVANKNISLDRSEVLRPDIIAASVEQGLFLIFEIKRARSTARETMTELLAYESEVRNQLPFLSAHEVALVVVSTEFSPLLDHAVAQLLLWQNKQVLCLRASSEGGKPELHVHLPTAWSAMGQTGLRGELVSCNAMVLYLGRSSSENPDSESLERMIESALELIRVDGVESRGHGFAMLVNDSWSKKLHTGPMLVIGSLDPYAFNRQALSQGFVTSEQTPLLSFLESDDRSFLMGATDAQAWHAMSRARLFLNRTIDVSIEGMGTWSSVRNQLRHRGYVEKVVFWGVIEEYVSDLWSRDAVRQNHFSYVEAGKVSWSAPEFAIPIIDSLAGMGAIEAGRLDSRAAFRLGRKLAYLHSISQSMLSGKFANAPATPAIYQWAELDCVLDLMELVQLWRMSSRVKAAPPAISLGSGALRFASPKEIARIVSKWTEPLIRWIRNEVIGEDFPIQQLAFEMGTQSYCFFDELSSSSFSQETKRQLADRLGQQSRMLLRYILEKVLQKDAAYLDEQKILAGIYEYYLRRTSDSEPNLEDVLDELDALSDDRHVELLESQLMAMLDGVVHPVMFGIDVSIANAFDETWYREQIRSFFSRGERYPAIVVNTAGFVGIGAVPDRMRSGLAPIESPEEELYVVRVIDGFGEVAMHYSWDLFLATEFSKNQPGTPLAEPVEDGNDEET